MLEEGHAVCNHTERHNISLSTGILRPGPNGMDNHGPDNSLPVHIRREINDLNNNRLIPATNGTTDFYGNTYGPSNPHTTFSFRPNNFSMPRTAYGIDREMNNNRGMPWIFGMVDPWDWTGHAASFMADFIMYGALPWCGGSPTGQHDCVRDGRARRCPVRPASSLPGNVPETSSSPVRGTPEAGLAPGHILTEWCAIRDSRYTGALDGGADGAVVLLHDGGMGWYRRPTVDVMSIVTPRLQAIGYHLVTVEQLFYYMNAEPVWLPQDMLPLWLGDYWYGTMPGFLRAPTATMSGPPWNHALGNPGTLSVCPVTGATIPPNTWWWADSRTPQTTAREGQGSQFGYNGHVRRNQGNRAGWIAGQNWPGAQPYTPTRIYRDGGHRPGFMPANTPPR
jgi:peptidoglycan/xylan/chitin deacetylase (PgdA/CDA1 family)